MGIRQAQARTYLEEAKLTLDASTAIFETAKNEHRNLWANVVKNCYDAIEQAVCSAIAGSSGEIPVAHPNKVRAFIKLFKPQKKVVRVLWYWLGKRAPAQYADIRNGTLSVPHELFSQADAERCLRETREIIDEVKRLAGKAGRA